MSLMNVLIGTSWVLNLY